MRCSARSSIVAAFVACVFLALTTGQAAGAGIKAGANNLLAIYGNPPAVLPVGGGLGRNFGFGANMLFESSEKIGEPIKITILGQVVAEARDSFIGGTLMSDKTGINNPLSLSIQFADLQENLSKGTPTPLYSDTSDRPWISELCSPEVGTVCKTDPILAGNAEGLVKIENVSLNVGPGSVIQGTVWGLWENGKPPCIRFRLPPAAVAADSLYVTQAAGGFPAVGSRLETISGRVCLASANNNWDPEFEEEFILNNKE
jgi:hypothetical protein